MTLAKLTQLIVESARLSDRERLKLAAHLESLQNSPDREDVSTETIAEHNTEGRKVLALLRSVGNRVDSRESTENRSIISSYAGSLEFSDDEFAAMIKELEEDK